MAIWLSPPTPPSFYLTLPSPAYVVHLQDFFWYQLRSHLLGESQQRALWQGEIFDRFNYQKIGEYLKKFMERVIKRDFFFFLQYTFFCDLVENTSCAWISKLCVSKSMHHLFSFCTTFQVPLNGCCLYISVVMLYLCMSDVYVSLRSLLN